MAGSQVTLDKLEIAITRMAEQTVESANDGVDEAALRYAHAAKELAEAHAWLRAAAQPH
jgi:hypothetical protein